MVLLGNLHFSAVELNDSRTASPYICIVQNSVVGKLVQGDDQIVVPLQGSGIYPCQVVCSRPGVYRVAQKNYAIILCPYLR